VIVNVEPSCIEKPRPTEANDGAAIDAASTARATKKRRRRRMRASLILDPGPSPVGIQRTPMGTGNDRERRHGAHAAAAGALRRRLLVLDAQLSERERPASRMAADPQHGHAGNL
jgi:hypothetical protein